MPSSRSTCSRPFHLALALLALLAAPAFAVAVLAAETTQQIEQRLYESVRYLASDDLEGRGIATKGIDKAADYIAEQFASIGLMTSAVNGGPFQSFEITTSSKLGPAGDNRLEFAGRASGPEAKDEVITLKLGKDFNTLAAGGSGEFDLPLVFAGYGITAEKAGYDDFAGIDVEGKCVILLRHQPQRGSPHSPFGEDPSPHAYFDTKISNAYAHGAAAIVFCTGGYELEQQLTANREAWQAAVDALAKANDEFKQIEKPTAEQQAEHIKGVTKLAAQIQRAAERIEQQKDPVLEFHRAGSGSPSRRMPIVYCRREAINHLLHVAADTDLDKLETEIDQTGKPHSFALEAWRAVGQTSVVREQQKVKNVIGVLEGEGPLADETIVIGAHYDHLGYGGEGSLQPGSKDIHNGADDNGSGIAVLLEVARRLVALQRSLPRRVVFIAFTAEERGLLGSAYYVKEPVVPLDKTIAMLNMDMVGRLNENKLIVHGTGTAPDLDALVDRLNAQHQFHIIKKPSGFGPSDHTSFYSKKIPVLHLFTGGHEDYHKPSDDYDKLNVAGMRRVGLLVADAATALSEAKTRPTYQETKQTAVAGGSWPYFGSRPDYAYEKPGVRMDGVAPDSPAERSGIKAGDVIVKFGEAKVATVRDFAGVLSKHKAGDKVPVVVERDGKEVTVTVILDPPRR